MTENTLAAEIVRLQKLDLDERVRESVEEAEKLLAEGRYLEAEALVENAGAKVRDAQAAAGAAS